MGSRRSSSANGVVSSTPDGCARCSTTKPKKRPTNRKRSWTRWSSTCPRKLRESSCRNILRYSGMKADPNKLDRIVAEARRAAAKREQGYREQALKIYPWICGRCGREFTHANLRELTVHHRDHDHDNNPPDGSNWELLCLYCHDNEHQRQLEAATGLGGKTEVAPLATHSPFARLKAMMEEKGKK